PRAQLTTGSRHPEERQRRRTPVLRVDLRRVDRHLLRRMTTRAAAPSPAFDLDAHRARIPLLASMIPMNNCSQAPQTLATRDAIECYLQSWRDDGMDWDAWMEEVSRAKQAFAKLINASADEI